MYMYFVFDPDLTRLDLITGVIIAKMTIMRCWIVFTRISSICVFQTWVKIDTMNPSMDLWGFVNVSSICLFSLAVVCPCLFVDLLGFCDLFVMTIYLSNNANWVTQALCLTQFFIKWVDSQININVYEQAFWWSDIIASVWKKEII